MTTFAPSAAGLAVAALLLAPLGPACAASPNPYPGKVVTIVGPNAVGGPADTLIRPIADKLSKMWGQPVVIDTKTGANGMIASQYVAKAAPDGYTILLALTGMIQNPSLYKNVPYDAFADFRPITQLGTQPMGLAVPTNSPYRDVGSLVAAIRAKPAQSTYGSFGTGSSAHIFGELLRSSAKLDIQHVPYRGDAALMPDLLSGRVQTAFVAANTAASRAKDKSLRILAVTGPTRLRDLPDVPTLAELGYKGFEPIGWYGLFVPAGTPQEIVDKIATDVRAVVRQPDISDRMHELIIEPTATSPEEFGSLMKTDFVKWRNLIKSANIELE